MQHVVLINGITAQAEEENKVSIYKVPRGYKFITTRVAVYFPRGSGGQVKVAFLRGNLKVYPDDGYFSGDGYPVETFADKEFNESDEIFLYYKNEDDDIQIFTYVLEGRIETEG